MKKKLGLRYAMSTVPLDPSHVRGTHGRLPGSPDGTPLIIGSSAQIPSSVEALVNSGRQVPAAAVKGLVLQTQGIDG